MRSEMVIIIVGMTLVTFATRVSSVAFFRQTGMPVRMERWLRHIPNAILTSLILPALVLPQGQIDLTLNNHYLLAGVVAAVVAYKTRNIVATLALGMGIMVMLRYWG